MNIRTFMAVGAILFATPVISAEFSKPENAGILDDKYSCVRIAWEDLENLQYGASSPLDHVDAEAFLVELESVKDKHGIYHFLVPVGCEWGKP